MLCAQAHRICWHYWVGVASAAIERRQLEILEADHVRLSRLADRVDLQADEAGGREGLVVGVGVVGGRDVVQPGLNAAALGNDAHVVPLAELERLAGGFVFGEVLEPDRLPFGATSLEVDSGGPFAVGAGVDLALVTVDALAVAFRPHVAAQLEAGVEVPVVDDEIAFEFEVAVVFVGAEKGVRRVGCGVADDAAVFDGVSASAAVLGPAGEVVAVEEVDGRGGEGRGGGRLAAPRGKGLNE